MRATHWQITLTLVWLACASLVQAKPEKWTDARGKPFTGEAVAIEGPIAIFRTTNIASIGVRLQALSNEDCVRLYRALQDRPARATDWANAESPLSKEVFEYAQHYEDGRVLPLDLRGRPEPELYLLLVGWHDHGESWEAINHMIPVYERLKKQYPGLFEAIFLGVQHNGDKHNRMIVQTKMPWIVFNLGDQPFLRTATNYARAKPPYLAVLTRDGALVYNSQPKVESVDAVLKEFESLLEMMQPGDPKSARDRAHYLTAINPVKYADSRCDPEMIAAPLTPEVLRENKIPRIDASLTVGADGKVTAVKVQNDDGLFGPQLVASLENVLMATVCVPAVDHGKFVEGTVPLHLVGAP